MPFDDSYANALRSRLQLIDSIGDEQTTWERIKNNRIRAQKARDEQLAQMRAQVEAYRQQGNNRQAIAGGLREIPGDLAYRGTPYGSIGQSANLPNTAPDGFSQFMSTIGKKESGGNYGAVNKFSGALGKYQIMPSNLSGKGRGWDYEALGRDVTSSQFLSSPEIQEKVARYKLQQYYNKYGPAGASIAWYAGPGAAAKYAKTGKVSTNTQAGGFPSIASYMNAIMRGLRK